MFQMTTIGAATRDVFVISDAFRAIHTELFPTGMGECVSLGSKIEIDEMVFSTGGGATNAAATFGSLGLRTACMTKIGHDSSGIDVLADLKRFGVSTSKVKKVAGNTAYSTLLTMPNGERTVLVHRGNSATFSSNDIDWSALTRTKWIYLTSLGGNISLSAKIIREAHKAGARIMWNPGSRELKAGLKKFKPLLGKIDILNMNREEGEMVTGMPSIKEMINVLDAPGMIRIITDGTEGSYAHKDGMLVHAGTTDAQAISRTGAGDAFGSGFLAAWISSEDLATALRVGTLNAESVIQKHGAKNGILRRLPSKKLQSTIPVRTL